MKEHYRKFGRVVRRESTVLVRVDAAGQAIEENGAFSCGPTDELRDLPDVDAGAVNETANAIASLVRPPVALERVIVSEGVAFHEFGERRWSDCTRRIHVSLARAPHRALIDLAEFSTGIIARVATALEQVEGVEQRPRIRLADHVGAAILPALIGTISMQQWAAPHDGKGDRVPNLQIGGDAPPNWFRPSYRARPARAWFHLRADATGHLDRELPEAIALLGPIHDRKMRLLCVDGSKAFVSTFAVDRILALAPSSNWYPYAAGCFGAEMVLSAED